MSLSERWHTYVNQVKFGWFGFWDSLTTMPQTDTYDYKEVAYGTPEYESAPWSWCCDSESRRYEFKDGEYKRVRNED